MTKSSVIKLAAPFERIKSLNPFPDIALRCAIIMQAIIDSTNTSSKKEARKAEYAAKEWIFVDNEDFTTICLEAGLEPYTIRRATKDLIKLQQNKSNQNKSNLKDEYIKSFKKNLFCNKNLKLH